MSRGFPYIVAAFALW